MPHVFSVRELTRAVKEVLEGEFPFVWVRGQLGRVTKPGSGHLYFTLKDEDTVLSVVWFKSNQWQEKGRVAEGLVEGMEVVCAGRLAVYPPRGVYQLQAEFVQEEGIGRLFLQFEALKKKLAAQGYFDPGRKRALPRHPQRVGVVTAPTGAAVRDFLRLAGERGVGAQIRIYPSLVQGEGAADNIVFALEQAALEEWAEVVAVIRGGGSLEDLWTFNTEPVADAIFASPLPVVTGIGHEVDTTIADLTADVRAATPSHAAQLMWPERTQLMQQVDELDSRIAALFRARLDREDARLDRLSRALGWLSPDSRLERLEERFVVAAERLARTGNERVRDAGDALRQLVGRLGRCFPHSSWLRRQGELDNAAARLIRTGNRMCEARERRLELAASGLSAVDPKAPLERGYSLVRLERDGSILRSSAQAGSGDGLDITLRHGSLKARVTDKK